MTIRAAPPRLQPMMTASFVASSIGQLRSEFLKVLSMKRKIIFYVLFNDCIRNEVTIIMVCIRKFNTPSGRQTVTLVTVRYVKVSGLLKLSCLLI
jgi:hypothetical protein